MIASLAISLNAVLGESLGPSPPRRRRGASGSSCGTRYTALNNDLPPDAQRKKVLAVMIPTARLAAFVGRNTGGGSRNYSGCCMHRCVCAARQKLGLC